ncbi:hypothetical protein CVT24_000962 [Panaeolus cyanescens]|uniref:Hydrophobin n=1 Tax=Panaeolus cyanescens TaxID=181874 RepID=A0A409YCG0_9AGAR|nr:hypothetical protein CVT24_000962 [Panaeolus cyanescens]
MHFTTTQLIATLATMIALGPSLATAGGAPSSCNTGKVQCCNKLVKSDSSEGQTLLGSIGVATQGVKGLVGANCSPITASAVGSGANCVSSPVCCTNNNFNGVVAFGCSPVTVNA